MSSSYGENIHLTIFGQSHSSAIGMTLEGIPAGETIDFAELHAFLERRAPGRNALSTARTEADQPEFLCGLNKDLLTCGTPITAIIRNQDMRSKDYSQLKRIPRPGHADYTAEIKYHGSQDYAGGGHFSGRMTAPLCIAGGICLQLLKKEGIVINAKVVKIGGETKEEKWNDIILAAKADGDSVGGIIECIAEGIPAGFGDPMFDGMENRIASIVFGIPAVKGIEFGTGFASADLFGSENNDAFCIKDGHISTETNHCGGILGGITNGMPLTFKVAVKPTPSIAKKQKSIDLVNMCETDLEIIGRHDPCIVLRALPCVEAACAIAVYDAFLQRKKELK